MFLDKGEIMALPHFLDETTLANATEAMASMLKAPTFQRHPSWIALGLVGYLIDTIEDNYGLAYLRRIQFRLRQIKDKDVI